MENAHDFSIIGLFMQADWVVKSIMIGLFLASVWCWAIIANRMAAYGRARRDMAAFDRAFASGLSLADLRDRQGSKTGTGPRGSTNDVGFVYAPGASAPTIVSVYITDAKGPIEEREAVIAAVARAVTRA